MADPNTRTGKRTPVTLKIKFKSETIEQFIERYAVDVSQGGIFIRTKEPLAVGTQMRFEFQLRDASPLIAGEGTVVWTRENDPSRPAIAPGMGVRFDKLAEGSPAVLERILAEKSKQQPARAPADTTKPPLFTDTPTRVAPAPAPDMLHGGGSSRPSQPRPRVDSIQPPAKAFQSDADEFPEEAFEEATKVRSLDELVAQSAQTDANDPAHDLFGSGPGGGGQTTIIPPDELALRRQQARLDQTIDEAAASSPLIEPPEHNEAKHLIDRDSAPGLPSPPSVDSGAQRAPRLLDTSPSPRSEALSEPPANKTRLGLEPAAAPSKFATQPGHTPAPAMTSSAARAAVATPAPAPAAKSTSASSSMGSMRALSEPLRPTKRPSIAPIVVIVIAFVAAAAAAVWFFILKDTVSEDDVVTAKPVVAPTPTPNPDVTPTPTPTPTPVGDGSAHVAASGTGSASATAITPAVKTVDTVIGSSIDKATVTLDEPALSGPAPFTAKLEPGKTYKAHISATGYATLDLDIKGGQTGILAKLVAKPKLLSVSSDPPGAQILIDGASTNHVTPFDVDLKMYAGKGKLRVTLRKAGFRQHDETIDVSAPSDVGGKMMITAPSATLALAPVIVRPVTPHPPPGVGPGSADTSGTPDTSGAGSSVTPPPETNNPPIPPPPTPTPTPTPTAGSSSAEPEPDFAK